MTEDQNDAQFMRNEARAKEDLMAAQTTKLTQQIADVRKHVKTICTYSPQCLFKLSSEIESSFQEFCLLSQSAKEKV